MSAADAYRWLDDSAQFSPPLDLPAILSALDERRPLPYLNTLETGVLPRHPEIAAALAELTAAGLHSP